MKRPVAVLLIIPITLAAGLLIAARGWAGTAINPDSAPSVVLIATSDLRQRDDARRFKRFIAQQPDALAELNKNPALINDPAFLHRHPQVRLFLQNNPSIRERLSHDPVFYLRHRR
jgi:hypothetical protein